MRNESRPILHSVFHIQYPVFTIHFPGDKSAGRFHAQGTQLCRKSLGALALVVCPLAFLLGASPFSVVLLRQLHVGRERLPIRPQNLLSGVESK